MLPPLTVFGRVERTDVFMKQQGWPALQPSKVTSDVASKSAPAQCGFAQHAAAQSSPVAMMRVASSFPGTSRLWPMIFVLHEGGAALAGRAEQH